MKKTRKKLAVEETPFTFVSSKGTERPVTIVGNILADNSFSIGVAVCGKDQRFNKELGIGIARNRSTVQPFMVIPDSNEITENIFSSVLVPGILSNLNNMQQLELQKFKRAKLVINAVIQE